jgi:hypothetical protein
MQSVSAVFAIIVDGIKNPAEWREIISILFVISLH